MREWLIEYGQRFAAPNFVAASGCCPISINLGHSLIFEGDLGQHPDIAVAAQNVYFVPRADMREAGTIIGARGYSFEKGHWWSQPRG